MCLSFARSVGTRYWYRSNRWSSRFTYVTSAYVNNTKKNRRIQIGWAWEDMNSFGIVQQGYQGALSRELFIQETPNVVPPRSKNPSSSVYTKQMDGTYTARTLGARPAPDIVQGLRKGSKISSYNVPIPSGKGDGKNSHMLTTCSVTRTNSPLSSSLQLEGLES